MEVFLTDTVSADKVFLYRQIPLNTLQEKVQIYQGRSARIKKLKITNPLCKLDHLLCFVAKLLFCHSQQNKLFVFSLHHLGRISSLISLTLLQISLALPWVFAWFPGPHLLLRVLVWAFTIISDRPGLQYPWPCLRFPLVLVGLPCSWLDSQDNTSQFELSLSSLIGGL